MMAQSMNQMQSINSNVHQIQFNKMIGQQKPNEGGAQAMSGAAALALPGAPVPQQTQQMQNAQLVA